MNNNGSNSLLRKFVIWRERNISDRTFVLIIAFVIGLLASLAAFVLHELIHFIQVMLTSHFYVDSSNWEFLVFPIVGVYLTSLFVKYVVKDNISHGITRVLYAISRKQSQLKRHNCWSSVIASSITIGFGGSVGAEAPIVLTGSAIGSWLGQFFKMDAKMLMVLLGCGASAAIAGIFKAPIAGLVFTLEVLMIDLSMASLLPILISCVTATCFSYVLVGDAVMFTFNLTDLWVIDRLPANILLGVFTGLVSLYFIRMMTACEGVFARLKDRPVVKLALGGILLSTLIFLFPSLYGEGYSAIDILLNGDNEAEWDAILNGSVFAGHSNLLIIYLSLVVLTKAIATSATNGAGGCGGTFAPSLFIGGFAGFLFARVWNMYQIGVHVPEKNFAMLGMAGVIAGVMHAPLTGIFLIAELTGGYDLFIPLMIVSVSSVMIISIFEPHSIYAMRLAREGKLLTHHTDHSVLTLMNMESVVEHEYTCVKPDMPLGQLINTIANSPSSFLPVVDDGGKLLGEIDVTKIRHIMFRQELYGRFFVSQIMTPVAATVGENDPMEHVMHKFEEHELNYIPITDVNGILKGVLSRTNVLSLYRKMVADYSSE